MFSDLFIEGVIIVLFSFLIEGGLFCPEKSSTGGDWEERESDELAVLKEGGHKQGGELLTVLDKLETPLLLGLAGWLDGDTGRTGERVGDGDEPILELNEKMGVEEDNGEEGDLGL